MINNLEKFNMLWIPKGMRPLTIDEYELETELNPDLWRDYSKQEKIAKKYNENIN